jgi:hypothetical protein
MIATRNSPILRGESGAPPSEADPGGGTTPVLTWLRLPRLTRYLVTRGSMRSAGANRSADFRSGLDAQNAAEALMHVWRMIAVSRPAVAAWRASACSAGPTLRIVKLRLEVRRGFAA